MRHYMAELGIFLSRDFLPYPNKYRAWSNNPVGQVDSNGQEDENGSSQSAGQGCISNASAPRKSPPSRSFPTYGSEFEAEKDAKAYIGKMYPGCKIEAIISGGCKSATTESYATLVDQRALDGGAVDPTGITPCSVQSYEFTWSIINYSIDRCTTRYAIKCGDGCYKYFIHQHLVVTDIFVTEQKTKGLVKYAGEWVSGSIVPLPPGVYLGTENRISFIANGQIEKLQGISPSLSTETIEDPGKGPQGISRDTDGKLRSRTEDELRLLREREEYSQLSKEATKAERSAEEVLKRVEATIKQNSKPIEIKPMPGRVPGTNRKPFGPTPTPRRR